MCRLGRVAGVLLFSALYFVSAFGQGTKALPPNSRLYLLAATISGKLDRTYPTTLYRLSGNKIEAVSEVVPAADGIRRVEAVTQAIFLLHPGTLATTATVVPVVNPAKTSRIQFSSTGVSPSPAAVALAAPPNAPTEELIPWISDFTDASHYKVTLKSVDDQGHVQIGKWDDYKWLRREGGIGGPGPNADLIGSIVSGQLAVTFFGHSTIIDSLPQELATSSRTIVPVIASASAEYLVLEVQTSRDELLSGKLSASRTLYVHDRKKNVWTTVQIDGNSSTLRLFGPWLGTIVGNWRANGGSNPGRESERTDIQATDRLPPVQTLYASFSGRSRSMLGLLVLYNLSDGRTIRIDTGQEDSEVLLVEGDTVLYRVNDSIYKAQISASELKSVALVTKGDDVPEIHWVFFST